MIGLILFTRENTGDGNGHSLHAEFLKAQFWDHRYFFCMSMIFIAAQRN